MVKDSEERYLNKIRQLELALEDQKARSAKEANDYSAESELSLNQLKNFYEIERERLEKRVLDEKSRYEKKLAQQNEDFEIKLKEEQNVINIYKHYKFLLKLKIIYRIMKKKLKT